MKKMFQLYYVHITVKVSERTIDSIVSQTYPIYELIIQDDCSTDDSMRIIYEYKQHYSFIHIYQNDVRLDILLISYLQLIKQQVIISLFDQDDIWELDKIEKQIQSINNSWLSFVLRSHFLTLQMLILTLVFPIWRGKDNVYNNNFRA